MSRTKTGDMPKGQGFFFLFLSVLLMNVLHDGDDDDKD